MKFLLPVLLLFSIQAFGQNWVRQNPYPVITELNDISLDEDGFGWVVGDNGVILQTIDGGSVWSINSNSFSSEDWTQVGHLPDTEGKEIIIGGEEIWRSINEGGSWEKIDIQIGSVVNIQIFSATEILIVGEDNIALSEDGGVSWNVSDGASSDGHLKSHFLDMQSGWVTTNDTYELYYTENGGETWSLTNTDPLSGQKPNAILFTNELNGYAFGEDFFGTEDGGATWTEIETSLSFRIISDFTIGANGHFYAANTAGGVLVSTDEGESWRDKTQLKRPSRTMRALIEVDGELWTVGNYISIVRSGDEFTTWEDQIPGSKNQFRTIQMYDEEYGLAGGNGGELVRTENGGNSWEIIELPEPTSTIWGIYIVDKMEAWIAGTNNIYKSIDGGKNWTVNYDQSPQANTDIYKHINGDLFFTHTRRKIYRSTDNGATWSIVHDGATGSNFGDINFTSEDVGYAVGYGSYAVKTMDGGATWTPLPLPGSGNETLTGNAFIDDNRGWVYTSRKIFSTLDGGQTWTDEPLPSPLAGVHIIRFENQKLGYLAGTSNTGKGIFCKTENAGEDWTIIQEDDIKNYSYSLAPGPKNKIWLAGEGGNIEVSGFCDEPPVIQNLIAPEKVCVGDQVDFEIEASNAVEFFWTYPADWIVVGNSNSSKITLSVGPSNGTVSISASNTCEFSDTFSQLVNTIEPISDVPIERMDSLVFTTVMADRYQWYLNGTLISGADQSSYTVLQNGAYRVDAFRDPCEAVSSIEITVNITSTNDIRNDAWVIYPNPGTDELYINSELNNAKVFLRSLDGALLLNQSIESGKARMELGGISSGIYLVEIMSNGNHGIKKLIIK